MDLSNKGESYAQENRNYWLTGCLGFSCGQLRYSSCILNSLEDHIHNVELLFCFFFVMLIGRRILSCVWCPLTIMLISTSTDQGTYTILQQGLQWQVYIFACICRWRMCHTKSTWHIQVSNTSPIISSHSSLFPARLSVLLYSLHYLSKYTWKPNWHNLQGLLVWTNSNHWAQSIDLHRRNGTHHKQSLHRN